MAPKGLVFADIEASGLQYLSYPIEIGWAWAEERHVEARSILIKPTEEWLGWKTGWNPRAEQAHGITLDELLQNGLEPAEACDRLNRELQQAEIAFDTGADAHDARWLSILYRAASAEPSFPIARLPSDACILGYARMLGIPDDVVRQLDRLAPKSTHRAAIDAAHWAWWMVALRLAAEEEPGSADAIRALGATVSVKSRPAGSRPA